MHTEHGTRGAVRSGAAGRTAENREDVTTRRKSTRAHRPLPGSDLFYVLHGDVPLRGTRSRAPHRHALSRSQNCNGQRFCHLSSAFPCQ